MNEDKAKDVFNEVSAGTSKVFLIKVDTETDNAKYQGEFELRYPNIKDTIAISVESAKLRDGVPADQLGTDGALLCSALAHLKVLCVKKPDWCKNYNELPYQVVSDIYIEFLEQRGFFRGDASRSDTENNKAEAGAATV